MKIRDSDFPFLQRNATHITERVHATLDWQFAFRSMGFQRFQPMPCVRVRNRVSEFIGHFGRLRDCVPAYRHNTGWKPVLQHAT